MVIRGGREQRTSVGNPGMGREQGERARSWARRSEMEMGKFTGAGFDGETGKQGAREREGLTITGGRWSWMIGGGRMAQLS